MTVFAAASDRHCEPATSGIDRAIRLSTATAVLAVAQISPGHALVTSPASDRAVPVLRRR